MATTDKSLSDIAHTAETPARVQAVPGARSAAVPYRALARDAQPSGRPFSAGPSAGVRAFYGLMIFILVGYAFSLIVRGQNGPSWDWLDAWGPCVFELVVSLAVIARGVLYPRDRKYAVLLGLAGCLWAAGDFIATYMGDSAPTLAIFNYVWAGFFPLAYVAVMVLMQRDVKKLTAANYLDGVILTTLTGAVLVAFAFNTIAVASGGGTEFAAVNLVYPVGDLLLFGLTLLGIMMLPRGQRTRWYVIAAAGAINAAGDISALFNGIVATDLGWFVNVIAWPTSLLLISCAVWLTPDSQVTVEENTASGFQVPTIASGFALLILFIGSIDHTSQVALGFATVTLLAAGIRFGLALMRLRKLTEERHAQLEDSAKVERDSREALQAAVRAYSQFAAQVADGDLTASVVAGGSQDLSELSESLNLMVSGLAEISREIQTGVHDIGGSTAEILDSVGHHTVSASQQSAAISETSATVNELRAAADETAQRAGDVAKQARDSVAVSDEGTRAVAAIASAMEEIREQVAGIAQEIQTLSERTEQIGAITQTVNELADRSNLLALNASIEAARAGEHGKGFAVVADQVRRLAEQSKGATAQVETILGDVQAATSAAVLASERGTKVVERGLSLTGRADEGIRSLTETIQAASDAAEQIASSAYQQSVGMDQIAEAMNNIDGGTAQFLNGAQQSHVAAENLNELAAKLQALTERYRV